MDSVAKAEQIRAIQISRLVSYYGRLDPDTLERIEAAIRITLAAQVTWSQAKGWRNRRFGLQYPNVVPSLLPSLGPSSRSGVVCR